MSPSCDGADESIIRCTCISSENNSQTNDSNCQYCLWKYPFASFFSFELASEKDTEKLRRIVTACAKGFSIGAGLKGGLVVFSILARLRSRWKSSSSR